MSKAILAQYSIYNLGGLSSYILSVLLTFLMESLVGEYYSWEYALALVICFVYLFSYHYLITFKCNDADVTRSMIGFMLMFAVFSIVNVALVRIAVFSYGMHYILAITLVGAIVSILTYVLNRKFIFQR